MALLTYNNVKIAGISACVPTQVVRNIDYDWISEAERELLVKTTGVSERRFAADKTTTSDLCFSAAEKLITQLNWRRDEIGALVFVSQSGDYFLPATAVILQHRLGLSKNCMALDIGLGCSGYVYGLSVISAILSGGNIKKALLLTGDKSSISLSPKDKSTYPLFGDAGTATALQYDVTAQPVFFNLQSDGSGYESIIIPHGLARNPVTLKSTQYQTIEKGIERRPLDLILKGTEIFDFTLREVIPNIKCLLEEYKKDIGAIDYFVFHQANLLINETLRKMLKIPPAKVPYSIHKFGNTSSASIPLTIVSQMQEAVTTGALQLLLSGFGVGLSWGTAIVHINKIVCPALIEYDE